MVLDNVGMVQVLEQIDFHLHVLQVSGAQVLEANLLDSDSLASAPIECPVHTAKGTLSQAVAQLVVLETSDILSSTLGCTFSAGPLFSLAGVAIVVGRGGRLLGMAWGVCGLGGRGLGGARVGGGMRSFWRVGDHIGRVVPLMPRYVRASEVVVAGQGQWVEGWRRRQRQTRVVLCRSHVPQQMAAVVV